MRHNIFFKIFFTLLVLTFVSCGKKNPETKDQPPVSVPQVEISADAQAIYAFLAYHEYLQEKRIDEAITALEQVIALDPTPELYLDFANLHWHTGNMGQAAQVTKEGLSLYPNSVPLLTALVKIYIAQGRHEDAALTLDEYLEHRPKNINLLHEFALYLIEQHEYEQALDRLQGISKDLVTARTNLLLGKAYAGLEQYEQAIKYYLLAVQADDKFYEAWIELALTYEAQKNNVAAVQIFSRLFEAGLDSQEIIFQLVELNLKLNNPDKAVSYVLQFSEDEALVLESANVLLAQGFYDHAALLLDPLAQQSAIPVNALFYLGVLEYEGCNNPSGALAYLEAIPADHELYERSLIFRMHLLYQDDEKEKAKELCLSAQELYPDQPEFVIIQADMLEYDNDLMGSLDVLLAAKHRWPQSTRILYRLALLYDQLGHDEKTMLTMEHILTLDPDHSNALNYIGYTFAEQGQHLERAEILIVNALRIEPYNGYYIDSLAWVYFKQGKLQQAWKEIRRAVQFVDDAVIWEHYGDIALSISLLEESKKGYTRAVAADGKNKDSVRKKLEALEQKP
ncbi:MAG: tetratricopeptide repeat protein [Desulfomicrobium sp.]|nr:tetratricopeptide repeat protein [Desulfomicrobium sp.]